MVTIANGGFQQIYFTPGTQRFLPYFLPLTILSSSQESMRMFLRYVLLKGNKKNFVLSRTRVGPLFLQ
jgi:hypothetical protein